MFGVNGIAFDGADALLAVNTTAGTLHRIALADAAITRVPLARPLAGPDGIRLERAGRAIVVEPGAGAVSRVDLSTGAIDILQDGLRDPTSLDLIEDAAWIAEGQLRHLFDMTAPAVPFEVVRVGL